MMGKLSLNVTAVRFGRMGANVRTNNSNLHGITNSIIVF